MQLSPQSVRRRKEKGGRRLPGGLKGSVLEGVGVGGRAREGVRVWRWRRGWCLVRPIEPNVVTVWLHVSHEPLITSNGMSFVCVLQKCNKRQWPWLSLLSHCLNSTEAEAVWLSANSSAEHKTPLLPLCSLGRVLPWLGQISRLLKWQMFFFVFFTSTLVCEIVSMRVWLLGNYLLGISKLWWMGVQSRCFNPDKGCLSVPWAPIRSPERYTNKIKLLPMCYFEQ